MCLETRWFPRIEDILCRFVRKKQSIIKIYRIKKLERYSSLLWIRRRRHNKKLNLRIITHVWTYKGLLYNGLKKRNRFFLKEEQTRWWLAWHLNDTNMMSIKAFYSSYYTRLVKVIFDFFRKKKECEYMLTWET